MSVLSLNSYCIVLYCIVTNLYISITKNKTTNLHSSRNKYLDELKFTSNNNIINILPSNLKTNFLCILFLLVHQLGMCQLSNLHSIFNSPVGLPGMLGRPPESKEQVLSKNDSSVAIHINCTNSFLDMALENFTFQFV